FWRMLSVVFGVIIALATARIGETFFGARGIATAALLVSLPTWLTLVARASNDGFACMWLALALMLTLRNAGVHAGWRGSVSLSVGGETPPVQPAGRRRSVI